MSQGRATANRAANSAAVMIRAEPAEFRRRVIAGHREAFRQEHGSTPSRVYLAARSLYDIVTVYRSIALGELASGEVVSFIALADFGLGVRSVSEPLLQVDDYLRSTDEEQRDRIRQFYQAISGTSYDTSIESDLARTQKIAQNTLDLLKLDPSGGRFVEECVRQISRGVKPGEKPVLPFAIDNVHTYRDFVLSGARFAKGVYQMIYHWSKS